MDKLTAINGILTPIKNSGFRAFFVGGCVRDEILGKEPHDFDIVTDATPSDLHKIFTKFSDIDSERFGITIIELNHENVEIATMREDSNTSIDSRHPDSVKFVKNINSDAKRRDFTINALYEDIDGNILDPLGTGIEDINNGILRFVGEPKDRLEEDNLRLLRLFRFLATKRTKSGNRFEIDSFTVGAIDALASISFSKGKSLLEGVSPERVGQEVRKLLGGDFAAETLRIMDDMVGLQIIVPNWNDMKVCKQNPKWHSEGNVGEHTLCVCDSMQKIEDHDWLDMAAALLHDIGKPLSGQKNGKKHSEDEWLDMHDHDLIGKDVFEKTIPSSWRLTLKESSILKDIINRHMIAHNIWKTNKVKQWKFFQSENSLRLLNLVRADCEGTVFLEKEEMSDFQNIVALPDFNIFTAKKLPTPVVNGNTLIENGIEPNRFFGGALEVAFNSQLMWIISHNFNDDFSKDDINRFVKDAKEFIKAKRKTNEK